MGPQAHVALLADIDELQRILEVKNLRGEFLLERRIEARSRCSIIAQSHFVMKNVPYDRFAVRGQEARCGFVVFLLIELEHVTTEVILIDQACFFRIELEQTRGYELVRRDDRTRISRQVPCRIA